MILLLTYHKVATQSDPRREFYTILREQLEQHLEWLRQAGYQFFSTDALLNSLEAPTQSNGKRTGDSPQRGCLLTFDDGTRDHFEVVLPVLERANVQALFFVSTAKLDQAGHLTTADVKFMNQAGHTIGSHSHEHRRLDCLAEEDARVQIEISRNLLSDITGAAPVSFAPPGGFITPTIRRVALESGMRLIRTMRWGFNRRPNAAALECIPLNRYTTDPQFRRILQGRNTLGVYAGKQVVKKLMPERFYKSLRAGIFNLIEGN